MVDAGLAALILIAVTVTILETVPELSRDWHRAFSVIEVVVSTLFIIEYVIRVWIAVEDRAGRYRHPVFGRLRYMLTPLAIIDLLAILPFIVALFLPGNLLFLRALRLVRIVKLARYSPAIALFEVVIYNQRAALAAGALMIVAAVIVLSGFIYLAESGVQPEVFGTIPDAMWWAVITMTTVGYGDVTPVTLAGRLIASLTSILGISMFAFPTAILGAGFAEELQKRDFNKMAAIVAKVPQFQHLSTAQLAEITTSLHIRQLPARYRVVRRGEHADSMYFIDSGKVVIRHADQSINLGPGDFFGELALLEGGRRVASVICLTACTVLELRAADFHRLIQEDETLKEIMEITANARRRS